MKKRFKVLAVLLVLVVTAISSLSVGCSEKGEKVDDTKTTIYVSNYDGGVGHEWLDKIEKRFEAEYANEEFEKGKKGVQIIVHNNKTVVIGDIAASEDNVFFVPGNQFQQYTNSLLDITDIVDDELKGDTDPDRNTIQEKLSQNVNDSLSVIGDKYYSLPHYQSFQGVSYNKTIFDTKNFYFAKDHAGFIEDKYEDKSCGPDGIFGTSDDGLPSSLEEFSDLLYYMDENGVAPFMWFSDGYASYFIYALWANLSGYNATYANVSFDSMGEEVELITGFESNGTPKIEKKVITPDKGYLITQQASKYYALNAASEIFSNTKYYDSRSGNSASYSHTDTQKNFLFSNYSNDSTVRATGMIIEGSYWENEAHISGALGDLKSSIETEQFESLEYSVMPLPVQVSGSVTPIGTLGENGISKADGYKQVCFGVSAGAMINAKVANNAGVERACKEFLKYCYTDQSLQEFTATTGVTKNVTYNLTDAQYEGLSFFKKSVWDMKKYNQVVELESNSPYYYKNLSTFTPQAIFDSTLNSNLVLPYSSLKNNKAQDYFLGLKKDATWWASLKK